MKLPPDVEVAAVSAYVSGETSKSVGARHGVACGTILAAVRRLGFETRRPGNRFAGGTTHTKRKGVWGYRKIMLDPPDPMACMIDASGRAYEHRVVLARKIGRPLLKSETVHHINGDRLDNRPENLQLRKGHHGRGAVLVCADCGSCNVVARALAEGEKEKLS